MEIHVLPSGSQWYFKIVASNKRTLASSETYWNKADALQAAQLIVSQASTARILVA